MLLSIDLPLGDQHDFYCLKSTNTKCPTKLAFLLTQNNFPRVYQNLYLRITSE